MKKIFVRQNCLGIIYLLCLALQVSAQKVVIQGREGWRKLTWADYSGKVDASSSFGAMTEYQFSYRVSEMEKSSDSIYFKNIEVILNFDHQKSWVKKDMMTDALLEHEQGHFNIGLMCVREFLTTIKSTKFIKAQYSARLKQIFQVVSNKYRQMHTQYDAETNHSINRTAQEKWNTFFKEKIPEGFGE